MSKEEESSMQAQTTQLMSVGIQPPSGLDMSKRIGAIINNNGTTMQ